MKTHYLNNIFRSAFLMLFLIMLSFQACKEDPCAGITCLNNGVCSTGNCICPNGYSGARCEILDGNICGNVICQNNGQCVDGLCECPDGWTGADCSIEQSNPCDDMNCVNGGLCVDGTCACPPGFSGEFCEITDTDPACENVICENGGLCIDGICLCPPGFTGLNCQTVIFNCNDTPCQNGGTCDLETGLCDCPPGYGGMDCATITDACIVYPIDCFNGGTCVDGICECPAGWDGQFCEQEVDLDIEGIYAGDMNCHLAGDTEQQVTITATGVGVNEFELVFEGQYNYTIIDVYDRNDGFDYAFIQGTNDITGGGLIIGTRFNMYVGQVDENQLVESCNGVLDKL